MNQLPPAGAELLQQWMWLFTLALPVATVAWTVTHEEIFREAREYFTAQTQHGGMLRRKFFYALTCEYCFSHYVTAFFLWLSGFHLLLDDRRGYVIAFFAVTAIANVYISLFARVRVDLKSERLDVAVKEEAIAKSETTKE